MAVALTNCAAVSQALPTLIAAVEGNLGDIPAQTPADAGFHSEAVLAKLAEGHGEVIVALGRKGRANARIDEQPYPHTAAMAARLATPKGRAAYRRRKAIVEPPNGWIKAVMGFREFSLRGLEKAKAEWALVCMAAKDM